MHIRYAPGDLVDVQARELRPAVPSSTGAQLQCVGCVVHARQNYISEPNQRGQQGTSSEGEGVALKLPDCSNEITSVGTAPPIFRVQQKTPCIINPPTFIYQIKKL